MPILTDDQADRLDRSVNELELSTRASNVLKTARIQIVRDLVVYSPQKLMKVRMCGKKTVKEIEVIVEELGFKLGMELPIEKIAGVSIIELAVAFATRGKAVCTYTDPRDGRETQNCGLVIHSIRRQGSYYDVEAELVCPSENVPIAICYDEEKKEGRVERKATRSG